MPSKDRARYSSDEAFDRHKGASERWRTTNPERARAIRRKAAKKWRRQHPLAAKEASRAKHLKRKYGMTSGEWDRLFDKQGRRCAMCGAGNDNTRWVTDHDHITDAVRGILCHECNIALGHYEHTYRVLCAQRYLGRDITCVL